MIVSRVSLIAARVREIASRGLTLPREDTPRRIGEGAACIEPAEAQIRATPLPGDYSFFYCRAAVLLFRADGNDLTVLNFQVSDRT